jgi:hypothetical protein
MKRILAISLLCSAPALAQYDPRSITVYGSVRALSQQDIDNYYYARQAQRWCAPSCLEDRERPVGQRGQ